MGLPSIHIEYPPWVEGYVDFERRYASDDDKIGLAIDLARKNVTHRTGGPFGAAVFEQESGALVAVGMNLVAPRNNSILHAEVVAFMMAEAKLGTYTLAGDGRPVHELATSCDPCAMCLAAVLWSGVARVLCSASHKDAKAISFDEGPVFQRSHEYMAERGIEFVRGVRREEAAAVMDLYAEKGGIVYNG